MIGILFIMNMEGLLEINKPEVRKIPEYEVLFKRDIGSTNDFDGRKKLIACAEIFYIYLLADVRSSIYNLPMEERKKRAKELSGLPDKWKEDIEIDKAFKRYKEDFKLSAAGKAYTVAEKAYFGIAEDTEDLIEELINIKELVKIKLKKLKAKNIGDGEFTTTANELTTVIGKINNNQKEILNNISNFTKLDKTVKELALKFTEEGGTFKIPVGGGSIGNREE